MFPITVNLNIVYKTGGDDLFTDDEIRSFTSHKEESVSSKFKAPESMIFYNTDSITDIKCKIQILTGINIYNQHLYVEMNKYSKLPVQLGYKVSNIPPDEKGLLYSLRNSTKIIMGIPANIEWYSIKDNVTIEFLEHQQTLGSLYEIMHKPRSIQINIIDLREILKLYNGSYDDITLSTLYSCIITPYFPMVASEDLFKLILFKKYKEIDLYYSRINPSSTYLLEKYNLMNDMIQNRKSIKLLSILQHITLTVNPPGQFVLYLRNILDLLTISEEMPLIVLYAPINKINLYVCKAKNGYTIHEKLVKDMQLNSLCIVVFINDIYTTITITSSFKLIIQINIHHHGILLRNETIDIISIPISNFVNEIIDRINKHGIKTSSTKLPHITPNSFVQTGINIIFKHNKKTDMTKAIDKFIASGFSKLLSNKFILNYGMHYYSNTLFRKFLPEIHNEYIHLINGEILEKWVKYVASVKYMEIINRHSDVLFIVNNIKNDEIQIAREIVQMILSFATESKDSVVQTKISLKSLKEQDPKLYKLKEIYDVPTIYSKVCQKSNQPITSFKPGPGYIKYKNFTTGYPLWYKCQNSKYPFLHFITGIHPSGFCLPCCKKTNISKSGARINPERKQIHSQCLQTGIYSKQKIQLTSSSKYITTYTSLLSPGRICKLPEESLSKLFNKYFNTNDCKNETDYYIFGVQQHLSNINNIGILFCIIHSLHTTIEKFIEELCKRLDSNWILLLNGSINLYYSSISELKFILRRYFIEALSPKEFINWNMFFITAIQIYWNINVIIFNEKNDVFVIDMPFNITDYDDILIDYENHIIAIESSNYYNLLCVLHTDTYFKDGIVHTNMFRLDSDAINIIQAMILSELDSIKYHENIDMRLLRRFLPCSKFWIHKIFINNNDNCYGILLGYDKDKKITKLNHKYDSNAFISDIKQYSSITLTSKNMIYISIYPSSYNINLGIKFSKIPVSMDESNNDPELMQLFMKEMNKYISYISTFNKSGFKSIKNEYGLITTYPFISIDKWVKLKSNTTHVIGFMSRDLIFYMNITIKDALKLDPAEIKNELYDYRVINKVINKKSKPSEDIVSLKSSYYRFKYNLYNSFVILFIKLILTYRNEEIRSELKTIIKRNPVAKLRNDKIKILLSEQYKDDYNKISQILGKPSDIINIIENSYYNFDNLLLNTLPMMNPEDCKLKLYKLMQSSVKISNDEKSSYMDDLYIDIDQKKISITRKKYDEIIDILAHDITNPILYRSIFMPLLIKTNLDDSFFNLNRINIPFNIFYGIKYEEFKRLR